MRLGFAALLAAGLGGCAMQGLPGGGSFGYNDGPLARPAPEAPRQSSSGGGGFSGIWNTVASPFRQNERKAADQAALSAAQFNAAEVQSLINAYRAKKRLAPLKLNAKLEQAAKAHSQDLAKNDRISHFGSDGSDIEERVRKAGYSFNLIAENVGAGQLTAAEVVTGWQKSPSHNENLLLPDAEHMGVALVYRKETQFQTFWTLVLGKGR